MTWKGPGGPPHQGLETFDTFSAPGLVSDPWIVVGKRAVTPSLTLDDWITQLRGLRAITYGEQCKPVEDERSTELGGEEAKLLAFHCPIDGPKAVAVQNLGIHGRYGWVVMCYSEHKVGSLKALEEKCEDWRRGFTFRG